MKLNILKTFRVLSLLLLAFATWSMPSQAFAGEAPAKFKLIHVDDLNALYKSDAGKVHVYDANNSDTRSKYGVIPGATLLDSYRTYDVAKTLPSDKSDKLVFYCANPKCMASHTAAERAVEAGYGNVNVLSDGIEGWKNSGQKVEPHKS